jgi:hypothetical protein
MAYTVVVHVASEDPILGEVDEMPKPTDTLIIVNNPRRRDGKDLPYLQTSVTTVLWPMERVNFIEILPGEDEERIIGFVRE